MFKIKLSLLSFIITTTLVSTSLYAKPLHHQHQQNFADQHLSVSADYIRLADGKLGSWLTGHVRIELGDNNYLKAKHVYQAYDVRNKKSVSEYIIFGEGKLIKGNQETNFKNGIFNPKTSVLIAERIIS